MTGPRARRAALLIAAGALTILSHITTLLAATSYLQGRTTTDLGRGLPGIGFSLESGSSKSATTAGGFFVMDGLVVGSRNRLRVTSSLVTGYVGPTFFVGVAPIIGDRELLVEPQSLVDWVKAPGVDPDGTFDDTLGAVFGIVEDASGAPVAGATVSITAGGNIFYFAGGLPVPPVTATSTDASGRFLILDVPPGEITVTAALGPTPAGLAYSEAIAGTLSGLELQPPTTISGSATDETGAAVGGATIAWGPFPLSVLTLTNGAGAYTLPGLAKGLDISIKGTAAGFRTGFGFKRAANEVTNLAAVDLTFLSNAAYASIPAAFGLAQAPSLGMIYGRVLKEDGSPLAGATVSIDPVVGTIGYFNGTVPSPGLTQTSSSGLFVIFNVPPGDVVLSALGPGETIRSAVAPTDAGAVTSGDLRGMPTIRVTGQISDEVFGTSSTAGAVVSVVEYPFLASLYGDADLDGTFSYTLTGVPAGEYLTYKVQRAGFKDSFSFIQKSPEADLECLDSARADCIDLFVISDTGFANLFTAAKSTPNRSDGLLSTGVELSNAVGAIGLKAELTPSSGSIIYQGTTKITTKQLGQVGRVQVLNATPAVAGLVVSDDRNDEASMGLVRLVADSVSAQKNLKLDCDLTPDGTFSNVYPCDGAKLAIGTKDAWFQWHKATNVKFQVQFSTDPTFATISATSAQAGGSKFTKKVFFHAQSTLWKKILKLGPSGTPVYWRVLGRDTSKVESTTFPYVFVLP